MLYSRLVRWLAACNLGYLHSLQILCIDYIYCSRDLVTVASCIESLIIAADTFRKKSTKTQRGNRKYCSVKLEGQYTTTRGAQARVNVSTWAVLLWCVLVCVYACIWLNKCSIFLFSILTINSHVLLGNTQLVSIS